VSKYEGASDPDDHLNAFIAAGGVEGWKLPVWCHMFVQTLVGPPRLCTRVYQRRKLIVLRNSSRNLCNSSASMSAILKIALEYSYRAEGSRVGGGFHCTT
jgi:hypothetical protein